MTTTFRLAPSAALRLTLAPQLLGLASILVAVVLTALGAAPGLRATLVALGAGFLIVSLALRWVRPWVLRVDDEGYRLRFVRGAGTSSGSWADIEDAVTAEVRGVRCLVLRRSDGSRTVVPVELVDREGAEVVRIVGEHLDRWHGQRRL